jgi:penicillin amidase
MVVIMFGIQKFIALIVALVIVVVSFIIFSFKLANVSVIDDFQEVESENVKNNVSIKTNYFGIPFITAKNDKDLFFAIGYYQASMRLWQMDYYRRLSSGKLSEIFGKETVKIDKFMRCFEIENIAKHNFDSLSAKSRSILESYSKGVNFYIKEHSSELSFEFNALNYKPEPWQPYQSLMVGKLLTFELSLSIWADVTFGEIIEKVGADKINQFLPDDFYSTTIYKQSELVDKNNKNKFSYFIDEIYDIKELLGVRGTSSGSNCWTITNKPINNSNSVIIANDAHLMLALPSRWMQMKIESPEIEAFGMTIPGIPLIMSGRNRNIGWGITNIMVDGFDYFIEKLDKKQEKFLSQDSIFKPITYIVDTIKIANQIPEVYYQRRTDKSIIISDFHILKDPETFLKVPIKSNNSAIFDKYPLSFRWIGNTLNDELLALYKINTASNFEDFKYGLRNWSTPGLNFHYIDKGGNIGCVSSAALPMRAANCNPNIPNPAWDVNYSWNGVKRLSDTTYSNFNPEKNFLASANNKLVQNQTNFISNYWEPESRIQRITELLNESVKYTYRDAQYMQTDYLSVYSREVVKIVIKVLDNYLSLLTDEEIKELNKLKNWDYIFSRGSQNASFFTFFYEKLIYNTFYDELGNRLYKQYSFISSIPTRKLLNLLNSEDSEVFDIKGTKNIENKEFIIFKSFRDAVVEFNGYFSNISYDNRIYGKMHKLTLEHPFSKSKFLKYAVNLGPFETGGNNTTINNGEWNINNPYNQVIGASMRIISDFGSDYIYSSLPGGISGDPMHPNYSDQLQIWLNGGYVRLNFYQNQNKNELKPFIAIIPK